MANRVSFAWHYMPVGFEWEEVFQCAKTVGDVGFLLEVCEVGSDGESGSRAGPSAAAMLRSGDVKKRVGWVPA